MDAVWIGRNGTKHGPYPARQVLDAQAGGKLQPGDLLWWQGLETWVALDAGIDKLRSALGIAVPPTGTISPPQQVPESTVRPAVEGASSGSPAVAATPSAAGAASDPVPERVTGEFVKTGAASARIGQQHIDPYRAPEAAVADPIEGEQDLVYAGFWVRFGALVLDTLIVGFAGFLLGSVIGFAMLAGVEHSGPFVAMTQLGGLVIGWLYYALFESGNARATPGKMAFRLQVMHVDTGERISFLRATGRFFGKIVSGLLLGIGYLMQPFTARRQALHDLISSSAVVETGPYSRVLLWGCLFIAFVPLIFALLGIGFLLFGLAGLRLR